MTHNDYIEITNLVVFANHGVLPEESSMGQKFVLSLKLYIDTLPVVSEDALEKSVNYAEVSDFVNDFTKENRCKLIETAADGIAKAVLMRYPTVNAVQVSLKKPWAPIGLPLDSVEVDIFRKRSIVYIGIGSNIGDKKAFLDMAISRLNDSKYCSVEKVAKYIITKPVSEIEQDDFLNSCIELKTLLSPHELLDFLHKIENEAGRTREIHWGPRTLDLDILLYDNLIIDDQTLRIPHPEMANREFVLNPLAEIAPYAYHSVKRDYVINLLEKVQNDNS